MKEFEGLRETLARAQAGDESVMEALLIQVRPTLEACSNDLHHDPDLSVADLIQEAWLRVWQKLGQFRGGNDDAATAAMFQAWLRQTGRNVMLNLLASRQAQRRRPPQRPMSIYAITDETSDVPHEMAAAPEKTPSEHARVSEDIRRVQAAIAQLPDEVDRRIVHLRFVDGRSLAQIAVELSMNYEEIRRRFQQVMASIAKELHSSY